MALSVKLRMRAALLGVALATATAPAMAADVVRIGTAAPAFTFSPIEIGIDAGIYQRLGLDVQKLEFSGAAKLNQGIMADAADLGATGSTDFAFQVKGAPSKTVGAIVNLPINMGIAVANNIASVDDLKGKKFGVTNTGTLTYWLALELARSKGWGKDGITAVPVGGVLATQIASLVTGQVDALVSDVAVGLTLAEQKRGRVLITAQDYAPNFMVNSLLASDAFISQHPDVLKRFLKGWYETVTYLLAHRAEAVAGGVKATGLPASVMDEEWETQQKMWSRDGRISPAQLEQLSRAIFEIGLVDSKVDLKPYYDQRFLP